MYPVLLYYKLYCIKCKINHYKYSVSFLTSRTAFCDDQLLFEIGTNVQIRDRNCKKMILTCVLEIFTKRPKIGQEIHFHFLKQTQQLKP